MSKLILYGCSLVMIGIVIFFSQGNFGLANESNHNADETHSEWQLLNIIAEETLTLVKENKFEASRKRLNDLTDHFLSIETGEYLERVEQVQLLIETIVQAREDLTRAEVDSQDVQRSVLKLRLTIDAVSHTERPIWIQFYPTVAQTLMDVDQALQQEDRDQFYHELNQLLTHYEFIRPSLFVSHPVGIVEELDSLMAHITDKKYELWQSKDKAIPVMESLERQFKRAFYQTVEPSKQSLYVLIIVMGSFICSVLGYVAWRKYKGETERKRVLKKDELL